MYFSVVSQAYTVHLVEENVLRGNAAILKCLIPSFVTEYVYVSSWIILEGNDEIEILLNDTVNNMGIFLVQLIFLYFPQFSTIFSSFNSPYLSGTNIINIAILLAVVTQAYTVNLMEESVLRGNSAILKCHISTFVTEYVSVSSWIISEAETDVLEIKAESNSLGTSFLGLSPFSCPPSLFFKFLFIL